MLELTEKQFEDALFQYPDLIEDNLILKGRQVELYGRRMDLLYEDKFRRKLIVELKVGPIKDHHIGQILSYEGMLLSADDPTIRVMLVGNRVPPNIQKALDHHGIAWKEITVSYLREFLKTKNPKLYDSIFGDRDTEKYRQSPYSKSQVMALKSLPQNKPALGKRPPAVFAIIKPEFMSQAFEYFKEGHSPLYFLTNSKMMAVGLNLEMKHVYFKESGSPEIAYVADYVGSTTENPSQYRLPKYKFEVGKYYYGFKNLRSIEQPLLITELRNFSTGKFLPVAQPAACIIEDPFD